MMAEQKAGQSYLSSVFLSLCVNYVGSVQLVNLASAMTGLA